MNLEGKGVKKEWKIMVSVQVEILSIRSTDLSTLNTDLLSAAAVKSTHLIIIVIIIIISIFNIIAIVIAITIIIIFTFGDIMCPIFPLSYSFSLSFCYH